MVMTLTDGPVGIWRLLFDGYWLYSTLSDARPMFLRRLDKQRDETLDPIENRAGLDADPRSASHSAAST